MPARRRTGPPPFELKYQLLPNRPGRRTLKIMSDDAGFLQWNEQHQDIKSGTWPIDPKKLDQRLLIYVSVHAPLRDKATTPAAIAGCGAKCFNDWEGNDWSQTVTFKNDRVLLYAGQHQINGLTLPNFAAAAVASGAAAPYMHGRIDKPQADQRLKAVGDFLVRESKSQAGKMVLCFRLHPHAGKMPCCSTIYPTSHIFILNAKDGDGVYLQGADYVHPNVETLVDFYVKNKMTIIDAKPRPHTLLRPVHVPEVSPADDQYDHPMQEYTVHPADAISYDATKILGKGNYGIVCKGHVRGMDAAVKVIKPQDPGNTFKRSREACVEDVMKEIFVMEKVASFGGHPNLLKLLAKDINIENPLIATEFCGGGSLLAVAKSEKPAAGQKDNMDWFNRLDSYALAIAKGMAYLETNSFVHRDLACRNILVGLENVVKIADFGLSRDVQETEGEYKMNTHMKPYANSEIFQEASNNVAWRWTAPEGLGDDEVFTIRSDVWSYGMTLAEMCQYGVKPYKYDPRWRVGAGAHGEFCEFISNGGHHEVKPTWPPLLQMVMESCWEVDPDDRPSFANLVKTFTRSIAAGSGGGGTGGTVDPDVEGGGADSGSVRRGTRLAPAAAGGGGGGGGGGGAGGPGGGASAPGCVMPSWFQPHMSGGEAVQLLSPLPEGTFVVRPSKAGPGMKALSINCGIVKGGPEIVHLLLVQTSTGDMQLGQAGLIQFRTETDLVNYYIQHPPANPTTGLPLDFIPFSG